MAQHNFEGDIEGINERQLEYINNVIKEQGFNGSKVTFEPVGKAGDNYVATVKRIIIEDENGSMQMIAKIAPSNEMIRMMLNSCMVFHNEHMMYTEILPKLLQLQIDSEVPKQEQLRFAKCYGSQNEQPNEVILLEDLKTSGCVMLDRFESLSNECVRSVLKNFGILHSLSYVLKQKEPETFEYFKSNLKDMWSASNDNAMEMAAIEQLKIYFQMLESNAVSALEDPEHIDMVKNKIAVCVPLAAELFKLEDGNKYSVIQQGDAWTNNIMFRFEGSTLKESVMIDYQLSKNGSPVYDFLYMTLNCTDHETRSKHFFEWIDYYHSELDKSLSNFGLKANFVYPRNQLDIDLKRYGKLLFGFSVALASMLTIKSEDARKFRDGMEEVCSSGSESKMADVAANMSISSLDNETVLRYKNKIIGLIHSCKQFELV